MADDAPAGLPSPRADLVSGGIWMVVGIAVAIGSWTMDRLEKQGVPAFAAPGLVPGMLGVLITVAGLAIVLRSLQRGAMAGSAAAGPGPSTSSGRTGGTAGQTEVEAGRAEVEASQTEVEAGQTEVEAGRSDTWRRAGLTLVLCLGFAAGLVGRVPFWIAATVYLFLHIFLLQLPERRAAGQVARGAVFAAAVAIVAGVTIALLFQHVFLVRLP
jgi:hypothetical protein